MKLKLTLLLTVLALAATAFAGTPSPTCKDGGYNFVFEAVPAGVSEPPPAVPHVSAWAYGGSVRDCSYWPSIAPGNSMKWRTGPVLSRDDATGAATFGPCDPTSSRCGLFFHVDNYGGSNTHLGCTVTNACTFSGKWSDFSVTVDQDSLNAGYYVYVLDGHASGTLCMPTLGCHFSNVTYHQNSLPFAGPCHAHPHIPAPEAEKLLACESSFGMSTEIRPISSRPLVGLMLLI